MRRYESLFLTLVLVFSVLLESLFSTAEASESIEQSVLRLHILANSNEEVDQQLKLAVRDRLLQEGELLFTGALSREEAVKRLEQNLPQLQQAAQQTVRQQGYDYPVTVAIAESHFDTRRYGDFSLPQGKYLALRVVIGAGDGQNWWCVLSPPLCLSAAGKEALFAVLSSEEQQLVAETDRFEVRLWLVDKLREWLNL